MEYIESNFFFEKYLVVGCSLTTLQEDIAMTQQSYNARRLKPSVLLKDIGEIKSIDGEKTLVDKAMLDVISDFCFPNGVLVKKLDYQPGKELFEQSEETSETISEILFR